MKKQIPNILSVIRLIMIPLFVWAFWSDSEHAMLWAAGIYTLAWATDVLDGYLARRFHWITNLGKVLDPMADKLMQTTAIICLIFARKLPIWVGILFIGKEVAMLIGAILIFRKRQSISSSHWYGKLATVILYVSVMTLFFLAPSPYSRHIVGIIIGGSVVFAIIMYYLKVYKRDKQKI